MRKVINNDGRCLLCEGIADDPHETHNGRNRQLSIKYGMVVGLCRKCHSKVHLNPKGPEDTKLREIGKKHFEENFHQLDFIEIFK